MKDVVWIICKSEEFYISMAIRSVIDHVDGIFILDQFSTDETLDIIDNFQFDSPEKVFYEQKDFGADKSFKFGSNYQEADARNYAMQRAIEIFKPERFLIQLDADEVYNDRFFELLDQIEDKDSLIHSTCLPVTPTMVSMHPLDCAKLYLKPDLRPITLFDPHVRAWKASLPVKWIKPEGYHVIPQIEGFPDYLATPKRVVSTDHVHFHLHRAFGPKSIATYMVNFKHAYEGAAKELGMPLEEVFNQKYFENRWPEWFENGKFRPLKQPESILWDKAKRFAVPMSHPLPHYVVKKWEEWGSWL